MRRVPTCERCGNHLWSNKSVCHCDDKASFDFFVAVKLALVNHFRPLGAELDFDPSYRASHMKTPTPRFTVRMNGKLVGHIYWDKDMCSPNRYFSLFTRETGDWGHNGNYRKATPEWVVELFSRQRACQPPGPNSFYEAVHGHIDSDTCVY